MNLLEKGKAAGHYLSGAFLQLYEELRFLITSNPEIDSQGGSFLWKTITNAVNSWKLRDDVKAQDVVVLDTVNDLFEIKDPYKLKARTKHTDFVNAIGNYGSGAGWADSGFVSNMPLLLFDADLVEKAIYMFYVTEEMLLDLNDPQVIFTVFSTIAATAGDKVVFDLECKYIAIGESPSKAADETLNVQYTITDTVANNRQNNIVLSLDRTLIQAGDVLFLTLTRDATNVNDTYPNDLGVSIYGLYYDRALN